MLTTRRIALIALLAAAAMLMCGAADSASAYVQPFQDLLIGGNPDISGGAIGGPDWAWSVNGPHHNSGPYNVYYRGSFRTPRRVNPPGTQALMGGIDVGWDTIHCCRPRLIFQQIHDGRSALRLFNLETHVYTDVPPRWNSGIWQSSPTLSFNYVLFGRTDREAHRSVILLGNLATGRLKVLASLTGPSAAERPGQVDGNWAVWTACPNVGVGCDVYEYNIATAHTTKVSNEFPSGSFQYDPSVAKDGTVYFFHSQGGCGEGVTMNRRKPGQPQRPFFALTEGLDAHQSSVLDVPKRAYRAVIYARLFCKAQQANLYLVPVPRGQLLQ